MSNQNKETPIFNGYEQAQAEYVRNRHAELTRLGRTQEEIMTILDDELSEYPSDDRAKLLEYAETLEVVRTPEPGDVRSPVPDVFAASRDNTVLMMMFGEANSIFDDISDLPSSTGDRAKELRELQSKLADWNKRMQKLTMKDVWRFDFADDRRDMEDDMVYRRLPEYLYDGGADLAYQTLLQHVIAQLEYTERLNVEITSQGFVKFKITDSTKPGEVRDATPNQFWSYIESIEEYEQQYWEPRSTEWKDLVGVTGFQVELTEASPFFKQLREDAEAALEAGENQDAEKEFEGLMRLVDTSGEDRMKRHLYVFLKVPADVRKTFPEDAEGLSKAKSAWAAEQVLAALTEHFPNRRYVTEYVDDHIAEAIYYS